MNLPKFAIDNHQFTIILFVLLLVMGVESLVNMPRTEDPPLDLPGASVVAIYPGASPADLEEMVAIPLEEALNELEDIKMISTGIRDGLVSTSIEFTFNTNAQEKFDEVVQQVNLTRGKLPDNLYDLQVLKWSSTDVIMLQLALCSPSANYKLLHEQATRLKKQLEKIPGIKQVEIVAAPEEETRVSLDMSKMAAMNLSVDRVEQAIRSNNANIPGGELVLDSRSYNVKTTGSYHTVEDIRRTVIDTYMGNLVYLEDIATVEKKYADRVYLGRANGVPAVFVTVKQKENLNVFNLFKKINPEIEKFRNTMSKEVTLVTLFDQTESVSERVNGFFVNLLQGIVLVGIVIFLSLGFRASMLVIIAIPLSIVISLGWVDASGFGLQQISIAALVIALGLLVDNSIVVTENIERFTRLGFNREEAAIKATTQLIWPVISATLTTMLAFIPIIMMPDKTGAFIKSLPVTVIYTLLASLLIALVLTPYLASRFFKTQAQQEAESLKSNQVKGLQTFLARIVNGPYRGTLLYSIRRPWVIFLSCLVAMLGSVLVFNTIGVQLFPKAEKPQFLIRVHLPEGSSLEKTDEVARQVESVLDTLPTVKSYATNVGRGNPRVYYNIFPRQQEKNYAEILVQLHHYNLKEFDQTIQQLREYFSRFPGAKINIKELEQGSPIEAPFTLKITGDNLDELKRISREVEARASEIAGLVNLENRLAKTSTDLKLVINREKAGVYAVPLYQVDKTIRAAIAGMPVSTYRDEEGKEHDIVLRLPFENRIGLNDLQSIHVPSITGEMIPLYHLARLEFSESPGLISRYNLSRDATLTADIQKGYYLDDIIAQLTPVLENYSWPKGYDYKFTGELESREESFGGMQKASLIALISIFAVLVLQFRSFMQPLIVLTAIPLAGIGSTIALLATGNSFSFTAFIGLISLIGIVVNNSIILVDYTNLLRKEGTPLLESVVEAGKTRFTPILLTTLTTTGGLLPLTLQGGSLWAPMGWTIIGGLIVSTFLTLVVVPVLYHVIEKRYESTFSPNASS